MKEVPLYILVSATHVQPLLVIKSVLLLLVLNYLCLVAQVTQDSLEGRVTWSTCMSSTSGYRPGTSDINPSKAATLLHTASLPSQQRDNVVHGPQMV